ncbi:MAG: hypothetical protein ACI9OJ_000491, partial [Myxococcota bacterium]
VADGQPTTFSSGGPGQNATMTFNGSLDQGIGVIAGGYSGCTTFTLRSPSGEALWGPNKLCTSLWTGVIILTETGDWTLEINPASTVVGDVNVSIYEVAQDVTVPIPLDGVKQVWPLETPGQNVSFTFEATQGESVILYAQKPLTKCIRWGLQSPTGAVLSATQKYCQNKTLGVYDITETGTYEVFADPDGGWVGDLSLTGWLVPDPINASVLYNGPEVTVDIAVPGQVVNFTTQIPPGTAFSFISHTPFTACAEYEVFDGNGVSLYYKASNCGDIFSPAITAPAVGPVTIVIDLPGISTGVIDMLISGP